MVAGRGARLLAVVLTCGALASPIPAAAQDGEVVIGPGVSYRPLQLSTAHGPVLGHVVTVDLSDPNAKLGLLHPGSVAAKGEIADQTNAAGAVAGVNGDFFNISEEHPGVVPTSSSVGPEIAGGEALKGAVPDGQRFGPALPEGTSDEDVFAVGIDGRARLSRLSVTGSAIWPGGAVDVEGLNQYALPVDGVGAYTDDWGEVSRARSVCGTDTDRSAPCSTATEEVVITDGVVRSETDLPGAGPIPDDTVVLVGREAGDAALEALDPGDPVRVSTALLPADGMPLSFAVGATPIMRDGTPIPGLDTAELAPRTAAGIGDDGRLVHLVVVDGRSPVSTGLNLAETAGLLADLGATDAVNLDGGGSTTMAVRTPGTPLATVRNAPSDGEQRPVANGIGVFTR
ncbi:phosphodiester glycosidase family protein [Saccharopolyspora sp. TS4A08]|uniref:Phosphodiester glycosidase family protein n=1 Tax=Saccharopolyspora ipomoeae TaxID=3042027 RepID=A0ABT6PW45_9PSEU|nr:phosphodiester glycosidase family protein [Saccharopolyspora sp. TS4A08]MDI2032229.1 phosphodiester glycosidase family protein [Saccharopolyspora sp. TS4A08]